MSVSTNSHQCGDNVQDRRCGDICLRNSLGYGMSDVWLVPLIYVSPFINRWWIDYFVSIKTLIF
jgi:hypothetical protein